MILSWLDYSVIKSQPMAVRPEELRAIQCVRVLGRPVEWRNDL